MKSAKGFTLVELIMVMILISILSGLGISLFSSSDQYASRLSLDQWLSGFRLSQRLALLKQDPNNLLNISIAQTSNSWDMDINLGGNNLNSFSVDRNNINVHMSTGDFSSPCAALPLATFPVLQNFNGYGDAVNNLGAQLNSSVRLCFVGQQSNELCLSPSGYAYVGSCQP